MSTGRSRTVSNKQAEKDTLTFHLLGFVFRIVILIMSRIVTLVIAVTLLVPLFIILMQFFGTPLASVGMALFQIVFWPVAITGRTDFTEEDLDVLILGWLAVLTIVPFVAAKLGLRLRIRIRYVLALITALYFIAWLCVMFTPDQTERASITGFFVVGLTACLGATAIFLALRRLQKMFDASKQTS